MVLMLMVFAGALFAQSGDKLLDELNRTDEIISRAAPVIEQSGNQDALRLLGEARRLQEQAWEAYRNRMPRRAGSLTSSARQRVRDALMLVEVSPDKVQAEIRRTAELMSEVGPLVGRSVEPRVAELWNMAQSEQGSARAEFEAQRYRFALKFTFAARQHTREAFDIVRRSIDPERVWAALERTDALIERAAEPVRAAGIERARLLLQKAVELQAQARTAFGNRESGKALRLTFASRDLALRAWEIAVGQAGPVLAERALRETDELFADWAGPIQDAGAEPLRLLEQARNLQQSARGSLGAGDCRAAYVATTRARRLLQRAIDLVQTGEPSGQQ